MSSYIQTSASAPGSIPASAGIGLRPQHHSWVIQQRPKAAWFEVHAENFMTHAAFCADLEVIARDYPLSLHAVGLSLGSIDPPDPEHLQLLADLVARFQPNLVSDHLSWNAVRGRHVPDLLPLPYTQEALQVVIRNVQRVQDVLKRELLLENPSKYLDGREPGSSEPEFLAEVVLRTGCGVLLDVNNLHVSAVNRGDDPADELASFLHALRVEDFGEIHLAGHSIVQLDHEKSFRLDDHGSPVCDDVWQLYESAIRALGPVPTLIEWDTQIPSFEVLQEETAVAQSLLQRNARQGTALAVAI
jgi:uncharacterized protein (UPF0276 family)